MQRLIPPRTDGVWARPPGRRTGKNLPDLAMDNQLLSEGVRLVRSAAAHFWTDCGPLL